MERLQKDLISEKENLCVKSVLNVLLEAQCSKIHRKVQKFREIFFHKKIKKKFKILRLFIALFSNFRALCVEHYLRNHIHHVHKGLKKKRTGIKRDCPQCDKKLINWHR